MCLEYFFPKTPARNEMPSAIKMRVGIIPLFIGHAACAILALSFVSIVTFVMQFFYVVTLYSIYMTLHTWLVWVYMVLLGFNAISGFFNVWLYDGIAFVSYLAILAYYGVAILKIRNDSHDFRNLGAENGVSNDYVGAGVNHIVEVARQNYRVPFGPQ